MLRSLCERLVLHLAPPRLIVGRDGVSPYLSRWYLLGARRELFPFNVFLHRFHRSDDDGALHSHPWKWSVSLILAGGYSEERRVGDEVTRRAVRPLSLNFISGETFHRIDLVERDAWSLFIAGPRAGAWCFWDRQKKARAHWREFIDWTEGKAGEPIWLSDRRAA